jgi:hypothetical protein
LCEFCNTLLRPENFDRPIPFSLTVKAVITSTPLDEPTLCWDGE